MVAQRALRLATPLAVLLAACETAPPPPRAASTALAPEAAIGQLAEALEAEGLTVERRADGLRVSTSDAAFVRCLAVNVRDSDRTVFTQVDERRGVVDVAVAGNGRTEVTWQGSFSGRYHNAVNNTYFQRDCESTGALEQLIARALDN